MAIPQFDPSRPISDSDGMMTRYFQSLIRSLIKAVNSVSSDTTAYTQEGLETLEDGEFIELEAGMVGYGECMIGDDQEWAHFRFTTAGAVTLVSNSTNVSTTNSGVNLCIYDGGSSVKIKNRLEGTLKLRYSIKYNPI